MSGSNNNNNNNNHNFVDVDDLIASKRKEAEEEATKNQQHQNIMDNSEEIKQDEKDEELKPAAAIATATPGRFEQKEPIRIESSEVEGEDVDSSVAKAPPTNNGTSTDAAAEKPSPSKAAAATTSNSSLITAVILKESANVPIGLKLKGSTSAAAGASKKPKGIRIIKIGPGSLSENTNLQVGMILYSINGQQFPSDVEAAEYIKQTVGALAIAAQWPPKNTSSDRDAKAKSRSRSGAGAGAATVPGAVGVSASEQEQDDALTQAALQSSDSRALAERRKNRTAGYAAAKQQSSSISDTPDADAAASQTISKPSEVERATSAPTTSNGKPSKTGKARRETAPATKPGVQHVQSGSNSSAAAKKSGGPGLGSANKPKQSVPRVEHMDGPIPILKTSTTPQTMVVNNVNNNVSQDTQAVMLDDDLMMQKKNAAMDGTSSSTAAAAAVGGTAVPTQRISDASRAKGLRGTREQAREVQARSEIPGGGTPPPSVQSSTATKPTSNVSTTPGANSLSGQGMSDNELEQAKMHEVAQAKSDDNNIVQAKSNDDDISRVKSDEEEGGSVIPGSIIGGSMIGPNGELIPVPDGYQPERIPTHTVSDRNLVVAAPVNEDDDEERRQDLDDAEMIDPEVEAKIQEERSRRRKRCLAGFLFGGLVVIGVIVALVVVLGEGEDKVEVAVAPTMPPTPSPSMAPTAAPTPYILDLPAYTLQAIENIPDSPQAKAYAWLMNDPNLADYDALREGNLLERFTLATFYYSMNGDEWTINTNWLSYDHDICLWHFVGDDNWEFPCRGSTIGRALTLIWQPDNNLRGTIPREISLLSELRGIQLDHNDNIVGTIPTEIFSLPKITDIVVHNNDISGTVPTEIGLASSLQRYYFGRTLIGGQLPTEIGLMSSMVDFNGARSGLIGTIPSEVGLIGGQLRNISFTRLVDIPDGRMGMSGTIPSEIGLLQGLRSIFFGVGGFSGMLPSEIGNLPLLEDLALYENNLEQSLPTELGLLTSLRGIWVTDNLFSGSIPSEIGLLDQNENFGYMLFDKNNFSGTLATELGLLSTNNMMQMDVSGNPALSGNIPEPLCGLGPIFTFTCGEGSSLCGCDCDCPADQQ